MAALTTIFFDAGNTLVFANPERTLAPLHERDIAPTQQQLHAAERAAKTELDRTIASSGHSTDRTYWETYYSCLLDSLGLQDMQLRDALVAASRTSLNWNVVRPGTRDILAAL